MSQQIRALIYDLIYPALLGTFIFAMISGDGGCRSPPWQLLLVLYYSIQYIEGRRPLSGKPPAEESLAIAVVGAGETALMVMAFAALYPGQFSEPPDFSAHFAAILAAIFFLPPAARAVAQRDLYRSDGSAFYWVLTGLSGGAIIVSLAWYAGLVPEVTAWYFVALILSFYVTFLTLANNHIPRRWKWLQRPASPRSTHSHARPAGPNPAYPVIWFILLTFVLFIAAERAGQKCRPARPYRASGSTFLGTINFRAGSAELTEWTREMIAYQAARLRACSSYHVRVAGHSDDRGSRLDNRRLSDNRARAVRNEFVLQGLDPGSVTTSSYGEEDPVSTDRTQSGRFHERRADVFYTCYSGREKL